MTEKDMATRLGEFIAYMIVVWVVLVVLGGATYFICKVVF